jgi:hypothetical protein
MWSPPVRTTPGGLRTSSRGFVFFLIIFGSGPDLPFHVGNDDEYPPPNLEQPTKLAAGSRVVRPRFIFIFSPFSPPGGIAADQTICLTLRGPYSQASRRAVAPIA